jgi:hypothetical protein
VVQYEKQEALASGRLLDEPHPDERSGLQIEGLAGLGNCASPSLPVPHLENFYREWRLWVDDLKNGTSFRLKGRPEKTVSGDDFVQGPLELAHVQWTLDAEGAAEVVRRRTGIHLVQQPEAPLHLAQMRRPVRWPWREL